MFNRTLGRRRLNSSAVSLAVVLFAAALLAALPPTASEPLRSVGRRLFEPGLIMAARADQSIERAFAVLGRRAGDAAQLAALESRVAALDARNRELTTALDAALVAQRAADAAATRQADSQPLLQPQGVRARVLGRQARQVLAAAAIIDAGAAAGVAKDQMALADPLAVIDQGRDVQVAVGQLALAGRRVWGQVIEAGLHTAVVRRVDQAGYRDVVLLAPANGGRPRPGGKGVLEGTGDRSCRVRLVKTTTPVEVGDLVFAADEPGLSPVRLVYGTVSRVERAQGTPHWDIWVEPSAAATEHDHLLIVRHQLNPARVAVAGTGP